MENFLIPEDPEYTESIRKFETTDPAHADLFNAVIQDLVNNETFLKKVAEEQLQLIEQHRKNNSNPHEVTPLQIGLKNVDNTSDTDKPISTEQQVEFDKKVDKIIGKGLSANDYTDAEKTKLDGIATGANNYVHPAYPNYNSGLYKITTDSQGHVLSAILVSKEDITGLGIPGQDTVYVHPSTHPANIITQDASRRFVSDAEKSSWNGMLNDANGYADGIYQQSTGYTDQAISDLIGGAPETLDTLKEVADAIHENATIVDALDAAIGTKANKTEFDSHNNNTNIHITPVERNKWNSKAETTVATNSNAGLMSATDKTKMDGISTGANNYVHPSTSGYKHVPVGGSSGQILRWGASGSAFWGAETNTWRGIQNNLTSTSTTDSLAAAQGKTLNDKITQLNTDLDKKLIVQNISIDNVTLPVGDQHVSINVPAKAGYIVYPMNVVFANASNAGIYSSYCNAYGFWINNGVMDVAIRNYATIPAKVQVQSRVIYIGV